LDALSCLQVFMHSLKIFELLKSFGNVPLNVCSILNHRLNHHRLNKKFRPACLCWVLWTAPRVSRPRRTTRPHICCTLLCAVCSDSMSHKLVGDLTQFSTP
jgi:hypothetical protein